VCGRTSVGCAGDSVNDHACDLVKQDVSTIRTLLGADLDELLMIMLDIDVFPIFLLADDRPRLVQARERVAEVLRRWVAAEPDVALV
jgi:hypothetical protein